MNLNIRFPRDMWKEYLIEMNNYSEFCRDAIIEKIKHDFSNKFIDQEIQKFQDIIKELKEKKKIKPVNEDKIQELLEYHAPNYKKNAEVRTEPQRIRFLENSILKDLKRLGSTKTPQEIDEILLNWPEG